LPTSVTEAKSSSSSENCTAQPYSN